MARIYSQYIYSQHIYQSLHVSGDCVPIIRRNNCVYATLGACYSVQMTVQYAPYIPDSHPHRLINTKCRIDTVVPPDDGYIFARNMQRKEINIIRKYVEIKCQLDATEVFIADLIACSTCFGHHYAHHQEIKSIIQWLLRVV